MTGIQNFLPSYFAINQNSQIETYKKQLVGTIASVAGMGLSCVGISAVLDSATHAALTYDSYDFCRLLRNTPIYCLTGNAVNIAKLLAVAAVCSGAAKLCLNEANKNLHPNNQAQKNVGIFTIAGLSGMGLSGVSLVAFLQGVNNIIDVARFGTATFTTLGLVSEIAHPLIIAYASYEAAKFCFNIAAKHQE